MMAYSLFRSLGQSRPRSRFHLAALSRPDVVARALGLFAVTALAAAVLPAAASPAPTGSTPAAAAAAASPTPPGPVTTGRDTVLPAPGAATKPPAGPPGGEPAEFEPPPADLIEFEPPPADLIEFEPPPSESPPPPPTLSSRPGAGLPAASRPARVFFELGLAGSALVNQGVYGFGGGIDLGARLRLPFGALGLSLRIALEQHIQPEPAPFLMNLGVAITYLIARPRWRVSPYVGLSAQGMLQRTPDALGAIALQRNEGGLTLGGLAGAQVRLWHGGIFTELGYRQTVYRQTQVVVPAWNTVFLLLGYRFTTN